MEKECGYFEFYDDEVSEWYKGLLRGLKPKKKKSHIFSEIGNPNLEFLVKLMIMVLVLLLLVVVIVGVVIMKNGY